MIHTIYQALNPLLSVHNIEKVLKLICESAKISLFLHLVGLSMMFQVDYNLFKVLKQKSAAEGFLICP